MSLCNNNNPFPAPWLWMELDFCTFVAPVNLLFYLKFAPMPFMEGNRIWVIRVYQYIVNLNFSKIPIWKFNTLTAIITLFTRILIT